MQIVVIVPTYNERENIESLVTQLLALPTAVRVIVVDDNSPDDTGAIADRLAAENNGRVMVIHRAGKLGLGTAYIAGFKRALAEGDDLICTMDADFSHNPRYVPDMVAKIEQGHDLVIGSRYVRGGGTSGCTLPRIFLSWGSNTFTRIALGLRAHDTTAGFRCYRREVLEQMDLDEIKASGYSFLVEMLYRVQRRGWRVGEVPIIFENRRLGASKISQDEVIKAMRTVLRLAWMRLRGKASRQIRMQVHQAQPPLSPCPLVSCIMEHVRCNLCGADDAAVRYPSTIEPGESGDWRAFRCTHSGYGRHPPIVQCRRCGLVYTNPRPDGDDIIETYQAVEDPLYLEEREGRVLTFEHHLKPLERLTGPPDGRPLLDVGAYTGVFVEIAARHGWDAWGVEPSRWAVEQAQARELHVVQGTLETAGLPEATFDVVTMWDVIEHLTDPREALRQAYRLLKPGGLLVVHTIDIESAFARLMGARWPWLMEMHIYYFSRRTLRAMLEACGFRVLNDRPQGRYLRLGYLMNRVGALIPPVGRPAEWLVTKLGLRGLAAPVNLGDLFTAYARKEAE